MTTDTAEPIVGEVVPYTPTTGVLEEYRPRIVMSPDEAKEMSEQLRAAMLAVLREGVDYGTIPGAGDKKNLLKPGAEKLLQWFGLGSETAEVKIERDDPDYPSGIADKVRRVGVTYRTEVTKTIPGGGKVIVATCEGYAGYDEDRYYVGAEEAIVKAEAKERHWAAKDKRQPNPAKWENAAEYRAPWNTLIKMSQKRSYVGAAIDATGAAGLFTQDMDDVAEAASVGQLATAGRAAIAALPANVGQALDEWYTTLNWPGPDAWNADQWCKALIKAGKLFTEATFAKAGVTMQERAREAQAPPPDDPSCATPPEGQPLDAGNPWLIEASQKASGFAAEDEGRAMWREVAAKAKAREITRDDAKSLQDLIQARISDLREVVEGVVVDPAAATGLDPEDPWSAKIDTITDEADGNAAKADVAQGVKAGHITAERAEVITNAINLRVMLVLGGKAA